MNFEDLMVKEFGEKYSSEETLAVSLHSQLFVQMHKLKR
jgi:hypothetical protein